MLDFVIPFAEFKSWALDSAVLLVTPVDAQPVVIIQRALKMFEGDLQPADIALNFRRQVIQYV